MNCSQIQNGDIIERYLNAKLPAEQREEFERHYFECDECFTMLEASRAMGQVLREAGSPALVARSRTQRMVLALAAVLLLAVVIRQQMSPSGHVARTAPSSATKAPLLLAEIQPPPYAPVVRRGASNGEPQAFQNAMAGYNRADWLATAAALDGVLAKFPKAEEARYFRSICLLLSGESSQAIDGLSGTIAAGSATPFEEEARYYRAQAYLLEDRRPEARADLDAVIAMRGDYAAKARELEGKL